MWNVYILKSQKDGKFYIGCTKSLRRRIKEHNAGYNAATAPRVPFILVYSEKYASQTEAYAREKIIKSYKGGSAFSKLFEKR